MFNWEESEADSELAGGIIWQILRPHQAPSWGEETKSRGPKDCQQELSTFRTIRKTQRLVALLTTGLTLGLLTEYLKVANVPALSSGSTQPYVPDEPHQLNREQLWMISSSLPLRSYKKWLRQNILQSLLSQLDIRGKPPKEDIQDASLTLSPLKYLHDSKSDRKIKDLWIKMQTWPNDKNTID